MENDHDSNLNPGAKEFVPSPLNNVCFNNSIKDDLVAQSPRKPNVMDEIILPSAQEFAEEISCRPHETNIIDLIENSETIGNNVKSISTKEELQYDEKLNDDYLDMGAKPATEELDFPEFKSESLPDASPNLIENIIDAPTTIVDNNQLEVVEEETDLFVVHDTQNGNSDVEKNVEELKPTIDDTDKTNDKQSQEVLIDNQLISGFCTGPIENNDNGRDNESLLFVDGIKDVTTQLGQLLTEAQIVTEEKGRETVPSVEALSITATNNEDVLVKEVDTPNDVGTVVEDILGLDVPASTNAPTNENNTTANHIATVDQHVEKLPKSTDSNTNEEKSEKIITNNKKQGESQNNEASCKLSKSIPDVVPVKKLANGKQNGTSVLKSTAAKQKVTSAPATNPKLTSASNVKLTSKVGMKQKDSVKPNTLKTTASASQPANKPRTVRQANSIVEANKSKPVQSKPKTEPIAPEKKPR